MSLRAKVYLLPHPKWVPACICCCLLTSTMVRYPARRGQSTRLLNMARVGIAARDEAKSTLGSQSRQPQHHATSSPALLYYTHCWWLSDICKYLQSASILPFAFKFSADGECQATISSCLQAMQDCGQLCCASKLCVRQNSRVAARSPHDGKYLPTYLKSMLQSNSN